MMDVVIFSGVAIILLLLLFWVARERPELRRSPARAEAKLPIEELSALHCRHFRLVQQALSTTDQEFLQERASPGIRSRARAERRQVARQFLAGLSQDFLRLERLGRTVAALSPAINRRQEAERFWLGLRFRLLYRLVWLRLETGSVPVPQLARLTELIGSLASRIETAMAALEETSLTAA